MRAAFNVTTTVQDVIARGTAWTIATLVNNSDTTIYVQWTEESDALTTANGIPIAANGGARTLLASDMPVRPAIKAIHGGAGNKELRYAIE